MRRRACVRLRLLGCEDACAYMRSCVSVGVEKCRCARGCAFACECAHKHQDNPCARPHAHPHEHARAHMSNEYFKCVPQQKCRSAPCGPRRLFVSRCAQLVAQGHLNQQSLACPPLQKGRCTCKPKFLPTCPRALPRGDSRVDFPPAALHGSSRLPFAPTCLAFRRVWMQQASSGS